MLFIKHFFVGCIDSEIPIVSLFGYFPLLKNQVDTTKIITKYKELTNIKIHLIIINQ